LSDQQGDYVYVVDAQNKAQIRRIQQGQSTPALAVVTNGLQEGELVIAEGLQRARPGAVVSPAPATPPPAISSPAISPAAQAGGNGGGASPAGGQPAQPGASGAKP
jgi:membrane fusion protein (multidrug efflux system)